MGTSCWPRPGFYCEHYAHSYDDKRKILKVTNSHVEQGDNGGLIIKSSEIHHFRLNSDGKLIDGRAYPEVSERLLEEDELLEIDKEDLMIMRNEPFAAHGYIFKNKFLREYFTSKPWYTPEFDNVNDRLSDIEKANIQLIKAVEDSK
jgi:YARHG domain